MEMDDDNDGEPPAPGTEEDGSGWAPIPPGIASTKVWKSCLYPLICCVFTSEKLSLNYIYFHWNRFWILQAHWGRVRNVKPVR